MQKWKSLFQKLRVERVNVKEKVNEKVAFEDW